MKLVLLLAVLFTFTNALPVENVLKNATISPQLVANETYAFAKEGKNNCTAKEMAYKNIECERNFVMAFRKNKNSDCRSQVELLKACVIKNLIECVQSESNDPKSFENGTASVDEMVKVFCPGEPLEVKDVEALFSPFAYILDCKSDFINATNKCHLDAFEKLRKNPGDEKNCQYYEERRHCLLQATETHCENLKEWLWSFNEDLNPYCIDNEVWKKSGNKSDENDRKDEKDLVDVEDDDDSDDHHHHHSHDHDDYHDEHDDYHDHHHDHDDHHNDHHDHRDHFDDYDHEHEHDPEYDNDHNHDHEDDHEHDHDYEHGDHDYKDDFDDYEEDEDEDW